MKKILEVNHKFLQYVMISLFPIGIAFMMVMGINIIVPQDANIRINLSAYPVWSGYLLLYGGFLLLIDFVIDMLIIPIVNWLISQHKKTPTLQDRIDSIR